MAEEYLNAFVQGIDLSPIQQTKVPENREFIVGEGLGFQRWKHGSSPSEVRLTLFQLTGGVTVGVPFMQDVYRILKPGNGWVQCAEFELLQCDDDCVPPDAATWK